MTLTFKTLDTLIDGHQMTLIVAEVGGSTLVGTICVLHEDRERAEIMRLFVRADCRTKGYGRLLISKAEEIAIASGCQSAALQVKAANRGVCEFYRKCGYFVGHEWDDGDILMVKRL